MKKRIWILVVMAVMTAACSTTHTLNESGQKFSLRGDASVIVGKTTKKDVYDTYGQPSTSIIQGKYEVLVYSYSKDTFKTMGIGGALLRAVPGVGDAMLLNDLSTDQGKADRENSGREWQDLEFYIELSTGIVRDYFYHDSELMGHDDSETMYLRSFAAFQQNKSTEGMKLLENAINANPSNHRAANQLAWRLIDLGTDVDRGVLLARKAVDIFPDSPYNNGTLGVGYYKKGDMVNAEKYLQAALDLFPIYAPNDGRSMMHDRAMLQTVQNQKKLQ